MERVRTGSDPLDAALGGGLPCGSTLLVEGPQGMGSTEFALTILKAATCVKGRKAVFATALRAPERARSEVSTLFGEEVARRIAFRPLRPTQAREDSMQALAELAPGDVLVLESIASLSRGKPPEGVAEMVQALSNAAHQVGAIVVCLHAPGTLPPDVEATVAEIVDGVFAFSWREGGASRRRSLAVTKLRGLAPMLDGEQVPVFEAALHVGSGFAVSSVRSVV